MSTRAFLSPKQRRFVDEYLIDLNASAAALRAGYSAKSSRDIGQQLIAKTHITAAITVAQAERAARVHLSQDAVLREIALLAHSDILDYTIDDHGDLQVREGLPRRVTRAVASLKKKITHTEAGMMYETEVRLWNKPASLKLAADHLGLNAPVKVAPTSPDGTEPWDGKVIYLPTKAPSPEAWAEAVTQLQPKPQAEA
jgi:phage terminase small subunit